MIRAILLGHPAAAAVVQAAVKLLTAATQTDSKSTSTNTSDKNTNNNTTTTNDTNTQHPAENRPGSGLGEGNRRRL